MQLQALHDGLCDEPGLRPPGGPVPGHHHLCVPVGLRGAGSEARALLDDPAEQGRSCVP